MKRLAHTEGVIHPEDPTSSAQSLSATPPPFWKFNAVESSSWEGFC